MRLHRSIAIVTVMTIAATAVAVAEDRRVTLTPSRKAATTDGVVEVHASLNAIYAAVTDYAAWPRFFRDVATVGVRNAHRERGELRFKSRALGHEVTIRFDNVANRVIRFRLVDGPAGARSTVVGAVGWFVTDGQIRRKRERKLRSDLEDLATRFPG